MRRLLVVTDRIGGEQNGCEVFCSSLLDSLSHHFITSVIVRTAEGSEAPRHFAKIFVVSPDQMINLLSTFDMSQFDLLYNLGCTSFASDICSYLKSREPHIKLVNHFQLVLAAYASAEGWGPEQARQTGAKQVALANVAAINIFPSSAEIQHASQWGVELRTQLTAIIPNGYVPLSQNGIHYSNGAKLVDRFTFLTAGRFSDYLKGADLVYRAFADVQRQYPSARLVVAANSERFTKLLRRSPPESISLLGWLPRHQLQQQMRLADAVVLPSRYEPFGMIAIEAMMAEVPVIAMRVGGLGESIHHDETGLLSELADGSYGIYRNMLALIENPMLARKLGVQGRHYATTEFAFDRTVLSVRKILANVMLSASRTQIEL